MIPKGPDALGAMRDRVSTRSYVGEPVDAAVIDALMGAAAEASHLSDAPPRVSLISGTELTSQVLTYVVGSYGLVLNAPHLLAGILPREDDAARVDLGYVLEQVVLEATRLGLGTCWVTGTYNREAAGGVLSVGPDEIVAAVCALGYPSGTRFGRFHSDAVRRLAGGRQRKPLSQIVFDREWGRRSTPEGADPSLATILKHSSIAPSASNRQPWRFVIRPDSVVLASVGRKPIDAGIVMSHFALAAEAAGRAGKWTLRLDDSSLAKECGMPDTATPIALFQ